MVKINIFDSTDVQSKIDSCISYAEDKCDDIIITMTKTFEKEVNFKGSNLDSINSGINTVFNIKPFVNSKSAKYLCTELNTKQIDHAIAVATASNKQDYFPLENSGKSSTINKFNEDVLNLEVKDLVSNNKKLIKDFDPNFKVVDITEETKAKQRIVANSAGANFEWKGTENTFFIETSKPEDVFRAEYDYDTRIDFVDKDKVVENSKENATLYFDKKKVEQLPKVVIIKDKVFLSILSKLLLENFVGSNKIKSNTAFIENFEDLDSNLNIRIFSDESNWLASSPVDEFGIKTGNMDLIKSGKVSNFVYTYTEAKKHNENITGNNTLNDVFFGNKEISGKHEEVGDAVVVESIIGAHTMRDHLGGNFTCKVVNGYVRKDGVKQALSDFMISGNIFEILREYISIDKNRFKSANSIVGSIATDKIHITQ